MTTLMIIVVGILGTVFLSFAAYKHWSDVAPTPRLNPIGIVGNRKFRIKWRWSWFWWAIGIGYLVIAYHYYPWEQLETGGKLQSLDPKSKVPARITDNTFVTIVRPGQPARVVMAPGWMMVWWGDKSRFTSHAIWEGKDKVRIFSVREGVEHAWIKIHTYHDPDPLWYTRQ